MKEIPKSNGVTKFVKDMLYLLGFIIFVSVSFYLEYTYGKYYILTSIASIVTFFGYSIILNNIALCRPLKYKLTKIDLPHHPRYILKENRLIFPFLPYYKLVDRHMYDIKKVEKKIDDLKRQRLINHREYYTHKLAPKKSRLIL